MAGLIITKVVEMIFFPPGVFIVLLLFSLFVFNKLGSLKRFLFLQMILIYILSIPFTNYYLFQYLEKTPPLDNIQSIADKAQIIVVLGGGKKKHAIEYNKPDVGKYTLQRIRYAAWLHHQTGLPLLVSGGIEEEGETEASLMRDVLQKEFGVSGTILMEDKSTNTWENASKTNRLLEQVNFNRIVLVTHAFHMPRSVDAFEKYNLTIMPAPTGFISNRMNYEWSDFVPDITALQKTYLAMHELIGYYWYQLKDEILIPPQEEPLPTAPEKQSGQQEHQLI